MKRVVISVLIVVYSLVRFWVGTVFSQEMQLSSWQVNVYFLVCSVLRQVTLFSSVFRFTLVELGHR